MNNKFLSAGGLFDAKSMHYNSSCDVYDIQNNEWKVISKILHDRLNPFIVPIGLEHALIIGGTKKNDQFVDKIEMVDI